MADNKSRQRATASRLKAKLRKSKESLADQFEFKMFVIFNFKDEAKKQAVFEVADVHPIMTNDYEQGLMEGVSRNKFSEESSVELLTRDVVQLHARQWQSRRSDVIGCTDKIDFMIWPRNDVLSVECSLFSRWKHEKSSSFRPCRSRFSFHHTEYESHLENHKNDIGHDGRYVLANEEESMFLFVSRHNLAPGRSHAVIYRINSLCVYLPQADLMNWDHGTMDKVLKPLLDSI